MTNKSKYKRLSFESLETRQVMAVDVTAVLSAGGVLTITGGNHDDVVTIDRTATQIKLIETDQAFLASKVKSIQIELGDGDDVLTFRNSFAKLPAWVGGAIKVEAGDGADQIKIPGGKTVYFGGTQDTVTVSRSGGLKVEGKSPDWFNYNVPMDEVGLKIRELAVDKVLDRHDMLEIFRQAAEKDVLGAEDFQALQAVGNNKSFFKNLEWVQCLSGYVVNENVANAKYRGQDMGNLSAESTGDQVTMLIEKWFEGKDYPKAKHDHENYTYEAAAGSLFDGEPHYTQVHQGASDDCYFLSGMDSIAAHNPQVIKDMFVYQNHTDGVYVLRFFDKGKAQYITIDSKLPVDADGYFVFDGDNTHYNDPDNILWAPFAEKAYAQLAELGWSRPGDAQNSYKSINYGYASTVMEQTTGQKAQLIDMPEAKAKDLVKAWQSNKPVALGSNNPTNNPLIASNHAYALIGYNANTQEFHLSNPWGVTNATEPATIWVTWDTISTYFDEVYIGSKVGTA